MTIKALVLDKDGVVFDSERIYAEALRAALQDLNVSLSESLLNSLFGMSTGASHSLLAKALKEKGARQEEFLTALFIHRDALLGQEGMPFVSGAVELLEQAKAKGLPLALVTSDDSESTMNDFMGSRRPDLMKYFDVIVTLENVLQPKPHPEAYQLAAERLGVAAAEMLVVEDSGLGATAALEAGAKTLLLRHAYEDGSSIQQKVHAVIENLEQVAQYW